MVSLRFSLGWLPDLANVDPAQLEQVPAFARGLVRELLEAAWWDGARTGAGIVALVLIVLFLLFTRRSPS